MRVAMAVFAGRLARRTTRREIWVFWRRQVIIEAVGLTLALACVAVEGRGTTLSRLSVPAGAIAREEDHVDPIELAQGIKDGRRGVRDLRLLEDPMAAGDDEVPHPVLPAATDDRPREPRSRIRELSLWPGGQPRRDGAVVPGLPNTNVARSRRRNTC